VVTTNRPADEHRFQLKYGSKDGLLHELWQDPFGLYTTLLIGINPERGFFVGADPLLNSPTRLFISKEFKESHARDISQDGWCAWARAQRPKMFAQESEVVETLVGGTASNFLKYVLFEREAFGEDQGHRHLLADHFASMEVSEAARQVAMFGEATSPSPRELHALEREFDLGAPELLEMIRNAPRLKMAVRGWVAQRHLSDLLGGLDDVTRVEPLERDGQPDFRVELRRGRQPVLVECKNVMRTTDRHGHPKLDFQRTRAPMGNRCGRYYAASEFQVVAACLHANTEEWNFAGRLTRDMNPHRTCEGRLSSNVYIDDTWSPNIDELLAIAAS
jgi:hypothetical protein